MCPYMSYGFTSTVTNNTSKTYERLQESKKILQPIHSLITYLYIQLYIDCLDTQLHHYSIHITLPD